MMYVSDLSNKNWVYIIKSCLFIVQLERNIFVIVLHEWPVGE